MCWSIIKYKINNYPHDQKPHTVEELQEAVQREWDNISMEVINALIKSFRRRLEMCVKVGGRSISQFLKANVKDIPEEYVVNEASKPMKFTEGLDNKLLLEYERCRRAWKLIGRLDDINMDPHLVKYRILTLLTQKSDNEARRIGYHNRDDEVTNVNDNTSIHSVLSTLSERRHFPIEDKNGLIVHIINMNDVLIDEEPRTTIDIPRENYNVFLVSTEHSEDDNDKYISYSSSSDDIMLSEPNSKNKICVH